MRIFDRYLRQWGLEPDGAPIRTATSRLLPVRQGAAAAMLKIARVEEERRGARVLAWWAGEGAARVLAQDGDALLMERAQGPGSLAAMARRGADDPEATRILCGAVARLHARRGRPPPGLVPLDDWFRDLWPAAERHGGVLRDSARHARAWLAEPRQPGVLHGDIHHGNVLDFGARGWLAIDPKGLHGERGFDYANLFCNPSRRTALARGRFERRLDIVAAASGIEPRRLLQWVLAWAGLSAVWMLQDDADPTGTLQVAARAAAALAV